MMTTNSQSVVESVPKANEFSESLELGKQIYELTKKLGDTSIDVLMATNEAIGPDEMWEAGGYKFKFTDMMSSGGVVTIENSEGEKLEMRFEDSGRTSIMQKSRHVYNDAKSGIENVKIINEKMRKFIPLIKEVEVMFDKAVEKRRKKKLMKEIPQPPVSIYPSIKTF